jgi:hypothetical protein
MWSWREADNPICYVEKCAGGLRQFAIQEEYLVLDLDTPKAE